MFSMHTILAPGSFIATMMRFHMFTYYMQIIVALK
jgi:hypothetical protein